MNSAYWSVYTWMHSGFDVNALGGVNANETYSRWFVWICSFYYRSHNNTLIRWDSEWYECPFQATKLLGPVIEELGIDYHISLQWYATLSSPVLTSLRGCIPATVSSPVYISSCTESTFRVALPISLYWFIVYRQTVYS